jgi:hypothetical protein
MNNPLQTLLCVILATGGTGVAVSGEPATPGWLGVQLGEVPPPLASHLGLSDTGVIVENIVKDSPADQAGLQRWDVVTHVDGQAIPAGSAVLTDAVQSKDAGATLAMTVRRGGQEMSVSVTLAQRPADIAPDRWKYEWSAGDVLRERVKSHGGIMARDPATGAWTWKDIGDSDVLVNLPPDVRKLLQRFRGSTTRVYEGQDRRSLSISVERNGQTIAITRENDGPFHVRRSAVRRPDEVTDKSYPDEEALRAGDEEAYEVYRDATHQSAFEAPVVSPLPPSFRFDRKAWEDVEDAWKRYSREMTKELEKLRDIDVLVPRGWTGPHGLPMGPPKPGDRAWFGEPGGPAERFRVEPDGRIEVTRRKGDAEVTDVYRNEEDLKARNPSVFERYRTAREEGGE